MRRWQPSSEFVRMHRFVEYNWHHQSNERQKSLESDSTSAFPCHSSLLCAPSSCRTCHSLIFGWHSIAYLKEISSLFLAWRCSKFEVNCYFSQYSLVAMQSVSFLCPLTFLFNSDNPFPRYWESDFITMQELFSLCQHNHDLAKMWVLKIELCFFSPRYPSWYHISLLNRPHRFSSPWLHPTIANKITPLDMGRFANDNYRNVALT